MPIPVACTCGQKLAAKEEFAGKTVKCPKCGQPLKIPVPDRRPQDISAAHQLLEEMGISHADEGPRCSECGESMPPDAVLCVHCGYHQKFKRFIKPEGAPAGPPSKKGPPKPRSETDKTLARAAGELEKEPLEQEKGYGSAWGGWALFLLLLCVAGGLIAGGIAFFTRMEKHYNALDAQRAAREEAGQ